MKPPITWPSGVKSAVCITFDLDAETAWISRDPENINRLSVMSQGAYGPKVGVPLILDFLDRNQMKSTFFVPGWTAERWPDVVAEIHRRGHEIGHHGYLHEALEGKSREEEEAILTGSSKILADITGRPPVGYRAPLYEITRETAGLLATARLPLREQPAGLAVAVPLRGHAVPRRAARLVDSRRRPVLRASACARISTARSSPVGGAVGVGRRVSRHSRASAD